MTAGQLVRADFGRRSWVTEGQRSDATVVHGGTTATLRPVQVSGDEAAPLPDTSVAVEHLYPDVSGSSLGRLFEMLADALQLASQSLSHFRADERIESDDAMLRLWPLLTKLFVAARELGDGPAALVGGLEQALSNRQGEPLDEAQLVAFQAALSRIRNEPALSMAAAVEEMLALDDVGLVTDPPELAALADIE
jgi:hypothetical protein